MSWIQKLYETYENCSTNNHFSDAPLMPISHTKQQVHVEIAIDNSGNFRGVKIIPKEETLIPATEASAGRSGKKVAPHPLCEKIQYCAADYPDYGGKKPSGFKEYESQLQKWCDSEYQHPKTIAILNYVRKRTLVQDLVNGKILFLDENEKLLTRWDGDNSPDIFKMLTADPKTKEKDQGNTFIRWQVWEEGNPNSAVWEDQSLQQAWVDYDANQKELKGICFITGKNISLSQNHPKRIRHAGDGAKLISSNDSSGFTFRGRFTDTSGLQACGVGFEVTQKAHNALRWLINRQGYRNGDQVVVAWSVGGKPVPDPFQNTLALLDANPTEHEQVNDVDIGDAGQLFSLNLKKAIAGYRANLEVTDDIVVMGLDSATTGRMAIIFYREMNGSEFLDRIEAWHEQFAWPQNFVKEKHFTGSPAPKDIAEAAYGHRNAKGIMQVNEKIQKMTIERLLPCIIDRQPIPLDLVNSTSRKAMNRAGLDHGDWEKYLGIACSLFKGYYKKRRYQMALEKERASRDYLYGRLLAIADSVEGFALERSEKKRDTMAGRLMQRFADHPFSTWRNIELALTPYKSRLRSSENTIGFLRNRERLLDEVHNAFQGEDFTNDRPLSGEFLLGFHCQRRELLKSANTENSNN